MTAYVCFRDDGPEHSEYIQQSVIPMFHFEKSLPRLPIPKLEDTCARYLTALKPLVSVEQLTATRDIVESFRDGAGKALHQQLVDKDKANRHTSYISGEVCLLSPRVEKLFMYRAICTG